VNAIAPPVSTFAVDTSWWQIGREKAAPATAATSFLTMPTAAYQPDDDPQWLSDGSLRGSPVKTYALTQGPIWAEHTVPESLVYGDTIGLPVYGLIGDYTATGTASTPTWTTSGALSPGAGPVAVTTGTVATASSYVQIDSTSNSEIVKVAATGSTSTSIAVDASTPIRFNHLSGVSVTTVVAPYTHQFSLLGPGSSTGNTSTEPPSLTVNHTTYIPGSGNYNAVQYLYGCMSEMTLSGKASGWLSWAGKLTSYSHAYPGSAPVAAFTAVKGEPAWTTVQTIGGTAVNDITDFSIALTRDMDVIPAANGQQAPYAILRGGLAATFKLTYNPALDESALNYMLANTQPTMQWVVGNGVSGAGKVQLTIAAQLGGYKKATLKANKTRWGYDVTGELIGNTTNAGNSGGYSPLMITLVNAIPTY
jgi:hypothetical protein